MKRAVAVSPHLDDAVLSCGATLAGLTAGGWDVVLMSVFTSGDDLAARRDDDRSAAERLGLARVVHLGVPSQPRGDDAAAARVAAALGPALDAARPERIFAPGGTDPDPEHHLTIDALRWLGHPAPIVRWRDTPHALTEALIRPRPDERGIPIAAARLEHKLAAIAAYRHLPADLQDALRAFHDAEGRRLGTGAPAEALTEPPPDRRRRAPRPEADDKAALVRALRGVRR